MPRSTRRWRGWQGAVVQLLQAELEEFAIDVQPEEVNWALLEPCFVRRLSPSDAVAWALACTQGLLLREALLLPRRDDARCLSSRPVGLGHDSACPTATRVAGAPAPSSGYTASRNGM